MSFMFPKDVELPPEPQVWSSWRWDPDPLTPDEKLYNDGFEDGIATERFHGRSTSKVVLLALGVGAALGFVAGWALR